MKIEERLLMIEKRQIAQWWDNITYFITILLMTILIFVFIDPPSKLMLDLTIVLVVLYVLLIILIQLCEKHEIKNLIKEYENQKKENNSAA